MNPLGINGATYEFLDYSDMLDVATGQFLVYLFVLLPFVVALMYILVSLGVIMVSGKEILSGKTSLFLIGIYLIIAPSLHTDGEIILENYPPTEKHEFHNNSYATDEAKIKLLNEGYKNEGLKVGIWHKKHENKTHSKESVEEFNKRREKIAFGSRIVGSLIVLLWIAIMSKDSEMFNKFQRKLKGKFGVFKDFTSKTNPKRREKRLLTKLLNNGSSYLTLKERNELFSLTNKRLLEEGKNWQYVNRIILMLSFKNDEIIDPWLKGGLYASLLKNKQIDEYSNYSNEVKTIVATRYLTSFVVIESLLNSKISSENVEKINGIVKGYERALENYHSDFDKIEKEYQAKGDERISQLLDEELRQFEDI